MCEGYVRQSAVCYYVSTFTSFAARRLIQLSPLRLFVRLLVRMLVLWLFIVRLLRRQAAVSSATAHLQAARSQTARRWAVSGYCSSGH